MSFVSEELFQRLPRRTDNEPPSICVTAYPQPQKTEGLAKRKYTWKDVSLEEEVEFVQGVVKSVRSIRGDYNLTPKMKLELYVKCLDEETAVKLRKHPDLLQVLSMSSCVNIMVDQTPPPGCAVQTVSAKCETHLMIKGLIDINKELTKLSGKKEQLNAQLIKVDDAMNIADYQSKVPESIQQKNTEKKTELTIEIEKLVQAINTLGTMQ